MDKCEIVKKAVETLNRVKGTNWQLSDVIEESSGEVSCFATFPSGYAQELGFVKLWFESSAWDELKSGCPYISYKANEKIQKETDQETRAMMRLIAWFWENRNMQC